MSVDERSLCSISATHGSPTPITSTSFNDRLHICRLQVLDELGRLLLNVCSAVCQGLVVFLPSFAYLAAVTERWAATKALAALNARKRVFVEPRSAQEVEPLLRQYEQCINGGGCDVGAGAEGSGRGGSGSSGGGSGGALLLSVIGGKLSEGINFGDGLGRCDV